MVRSEPSGTERVKLPSMSVVVATPVNAADTTLAPMSGSESVAERTVPCTMMFWACAPSAIRKSNNAPRIVFFMLFVK